MADPDEFDVSARGLLLSVFENARSSLVARVDHGASADGGAARAEAHTSKVWASDDVDVPVLRSA
ncbi:hypothetical protein ACGFRG_32415 [Streptomyces sp. NPDC048696]|uniref:hypothetical protein n=1 Tax=Streptomyces sp. NPDC048696 TaxID=3365585 RepID=UPI0037230A1C